LNVENNIKIAGGSQNVFVWYNMVVNPRRKKWQFVHWVVEKRLSHIQRVQDKEVGSIRSILLPVGIKQESRIGVKEGNERVIVHFSR
jgi:hypothetical protein